MPVRLKQFLPGGQFEQGDALLNAPAGDAEEVLSVGLGESPVALGDVCRDGQGGTVELVGEEEALRLTLLPQDQESGFGVRRGRFVNKGVSRFFYSLLSTLSCSSPHFSPGEELRF